MQLQKCINRAQKIQQQHEDNTIAQEMLLEEMTPVTSNSINKIKHM